MMLFPAGEAAAYLRRSLDELQQAHGDGAGGHELARRRADVVDFALISLFRDAEQQTLAGGLYRASGVAVVALGGYGRRELSPYSDVDLMLLYRPEESERMQRMAEHLFYPLWDAGLELGHGARTIAESLRVAAEDLALETSLLQARFLVGDQELFQECQEQLRLQVLADGGQGFVARLLAARTTRREANGPASALLEPHLKEGEGGLRDVHELLWLAVALRGGGGLDGVQAAGWSRPDELEELDAAVEVLLQARNALHYAAGRKVDRLYLDYQEDLARAAAMRAAKVGATKSAAGRSKSGATDGEAAVALHALMSSVARAAESITLISDDVWEAVAREVGIAGRRHAVDLPARLPVDGVGRRSLLGELLREGVGGAARLRRLSHRGVLAEWLPGWDTIRYLGQRDSLHTYTVDGHSFRSVEAAVEMATSGGPDQLGGLLASELALTPQWEGFLLACLLHDLGKGVDTPDHAQTGAGLAAAAVAALGELPAVQADVEFLVREHLLLPDTAARRDLDDPALLARLAERIGTRRRLEMLYVLTVSDSTATGPATWTPWVATLVQELFFKVLHEIEGAERVVPVQMPEREERLRAVIPGGPLGEDLVVLVHSGQLPGVEELSVVSPARAGLLTRLCGVLACHGITIMSAQVQPQADDRIARVFQVADYFGATIPPDRWESVRVDLARALEGRLALDYRLAERAARYAPRVAALRHEPSRVVLENAASESLTIIEVHTVDRIGLLYTIAQALDDLLLDVRLAKVSTLKEKAVDVFYVTDAWGRKLVESDHLQEVERAVVFALDRDERA